MQVKNVFVWVETVTKDVVLEIWYIYTGTWLHQKQSRSLCVFKLISDHVIYLVLYVDDMLLVRNDEEIIWDLKTQLSSKFEMKDLGTANYILVMEI